jgi:transposase
MVFFIPWRVVAEESGAAHYGFGGAMLLDVADFHFSDIPVRGDDGARAIGATDDAAAAAAAVELRGRRRHTPDRKPTPPTPGATLRYLPKYSPDLNPIEQASANSRRIYEKQPSEPFRVCRAGSATSWPHSARNNARRGRSSLRCR